MYKYYEIIAHQNIIIIIFIRKIKLKNFPNNL